MTLTHFNDKKKNLLNFLLKADNHTFKASGNKEERCGITYVNSRGVKYLLYLSMITIQAYYLHFHLSDSF